jgi:hypothetical protein
LLNHRNVCRIFVQSCRFCVHAAPRAEESFETARQDARPVRRNMTLLPRNAATHMPLRAGWRSFHRHRSARRGTPRRDPHRFFRIAVA